MKLNVLLLSTAGHRNLVTTTFFDYLYSFNRFSKHDYFYHSFFDQISDDFDFSDFDIILLFYNFNYATVSEQILSKLKKADATKVLFFQDEYADVNSRQEFMDRIGVNLMFTCVAEEDHELFYPKSKISSLKEVHTVLTGYVPEHLEARPLNLNNHREYDIGYRSRAVPYMLGDLAREKIIIAEKFSEICESQGLKYNISVRENDRIYEEQWFKYLENSRCQLGTESGSSIVDFAGDLADLELAERLKNPHLSYEEFHKSFLTEVEGKHHIKAISPRIFEYAACGTAPILFEGRYSGIIEPEVNYIELKKDFSNIESVLEKVRDVEYCQNMTRRNYQQLIESKKYTYKEFIANFDKIISQHHTKSKKSKISKAKFYLSRIFQDKQGRIPYGKRHILVPFNKNGFLELRHNIGAKIAYKLPLLGKDIKEIGGDPLYRLFIAAASIYATRFTSFDKKYFTRKYFKSFSSKNYMQWLYELLLLSHTQSDYLALSKSSEDIGFRYIYSEEKKQIILEPTSETLGVQYIYNEQLIPAVKFWNNIVQAIKMDKLDKILLDVAKRHPPQKYHVATIFCFRCFFKYIDYRSEYDSYFHLDSLLACVKHNPQENISLLAKLVEDSNNDQLLPKLGNTSSYQYLMHRSCAFGIKVTHKIYSVSLNLFNRVSNKIVSVLNKITKKAISIVNKISTLLLNITHKAIIFLTKIGSRFETLCLLLYRKISLIVRFIISFFMLLYYMAV